MSITTCKRCVMNDGSDQYISFDEEGNCNYCTKALNDLPNIYFPNEGGKQKLENLVTRLKEENRDKKYDCLMGISGGLDSSYLAYLGAVKWGLRIKAVHIDDGYDTEISKSNIEKLCKTANIELTTITPNPEQYNDLIKAYMLASVPNMAAPQDNILLAFLYDFARENNIKHFLSGGNFALEYILQKGNSYDSGDSVNIKSIHKLYGTRAINELKLISKLKRFYYEKFLKIESLRPLNYIDYNRDRAFEELKEFCGFEYYGRKHLENYLTAFIQLYWMTHKFGVDKRTSHLSSMIVSGQMTRDKAITELQEPLYEKAYMENIIDMILKNVGVSKMEFNKIMQQSAKQHTDYKTDKLYKFVKELVG